MMASLIHCPLVHDAVRKSSEPGAQKGEARPSHTSAA